MDGLTTTLPILILKHDHPQVEGKPPTRGEGNLSFTARRKEVTNTANNQPRLKIGATSTTIKYAWVVTSYPAKEMILW